MAWQPDILTHPDAELLAAGYLRTELTGSPETYAQNVYVSNEAPATTSRSVVTVRRDGGPIRDIYDYPRLTVSVWAEREQDASDLARLVHALMVAARGRADGVVDTTSLSGPSGVADDAAFQKYMSVEWKVRPIAA